MIRHVRACMCACVCLRKQEINSDFILHELPSFFETLGSGARLAGQWTPEIHLTSTRVPNPEHCHMPLKYMGSEAITQCLAHYHLSYLLAPLPSFYSLSFGWLLGKTIGLMTAAIRKITVVNILTHPRKNWPCFAFQLFPLNVYTNRTGLLGPSDLSEGTFPYSFTVLSQYPWQK